jgi:hypothetical protein
MHECVNYVLSILRIISGIHFIYYSFIVLVK